MVPIRAARPGPSTHQRSGTDWPVTITVKAKALAETFFPQGMVPRTHCGPGVNRHHVPGVGEPSWGLQGAGAVTRRELNCWHSLWLGQGIRTFLWPRAELLAWESNIFISSGLPGHIEVPLGDAGVNSLGKHRHCCVPLTLGWVPRSKLSPGLGIWLPSAIGGAVPSTGGCQRLSVRLGPVRGSPKPGRKQVAPCRPAGVWGTAWRPQSWPLFPVQTPRDSELREGIRPLGLAGPTASATLCWFLSSRPLRGLWGPRSGSRTRRCPRPLTPARPPQRPLCPLFAALYHRRDFLRTNVPLLPGCKPGACGEEATCRPRLGGRTVWAQSVNSARCPCRDGRHLLDQWLPRL